MVATVDMHESGTTTESEKISQIRTTHLKSSTNSLTRIELINESSKTASSLGCDWVEAELRYPKSG